MKKFILLFFVSISLFAQINESWTTEQQRLARKGDIKDTLSLYKNNQGYINIIDFGASTLSDDNYIAIQRAIDSAEVNGKAVYIPEGIFKVGHKLTSNVGITIKGEGYRSQIKAEMLDTCLVIRSVNKVELHDFVVISDYTSITSNIDVGIALVDCNRSNIRNVVVYGFELGWYINGWIYNMSNAWAKECSVGFDLNNVNASVLDLNIEIVEKGFRMYLCAGTTINVMVEDYVGVQQPSTVDSCSGITFNSPYFEAGVTKQDTSHLAIGHTNYCKDIIISGANIVVAEIPQYLIELDKVKNIQISGYFSSTSLKSIKTTPNTSGLIFRSANYYNQVLTDNGNILNPIYNYFPNDSFEHYFGGWYKVNHIRTTKAEETNYVRSGHKSLKLTATSGQSYNYTQFYINGSAVTALRSKLITVSGWMYIPDSSFFDEGSRSAYPQIKVYSYNGSVSTSEISTPTGLAKGEWNYINASITLQSDATEIWLAVYVNNSSNVMTGNEWIVIDDFAIVQGRIMPYDVIMYSKPSPLNNSKVEGSKLVIYDSAIPTDTDMYFNVGDRLYYTTPTAGGYVGAICTSSGSVGTWKTFGAIAN